MPATDRWLRKPDANDANDVWTLGNITQMDAVVAACALVSRADGRITPDERTRMVERMRHSPTIAFLGTDDVLARLEALNLRFERDPDEGEEAAELAVIRLRGQPGPSRLLIDTACSVAEADGGFDDRERTVILRLCKLLGIDPEPWSVRPDAEGGD